MGRIQLESFLETGNGALRVIHREVYQRGAVVGLGVIGHDLRGAAEFENGSRVVVLQSQSFASRQEARFFLGGRSHARRQNADSGDGNGESSRPEIRQGEYIHLARVVSRALRRGGTLRSRV